MKRNSVDAIEDLKDKRAVPFYDFALKSGQTPRESRKTIKKLAAKGYVRAYHGDSVVAITRRGLKAGKEEIMSSLG